MKIDWQANANNSMDLFGVAQKTHLRDQILNWINTNAGNWAIGTTMSKSFSWLGSDFRAEATRTAADRVSIDLIEAN